MKYLIDTHCHIADEQYKQQEVIDIIKKCQQENIIICSMSTNFEDFQQNLEYSKHDNVFIGFGIHPYEAHKIINTPNWQDIAIQTLKSKNPKIKFIGEVGLDFYKIQETKKEQIEVFEFFVNLAKDYMLPLSIHTRNAEEETISILLKYQKNKPIKAIFHCFTSTQTNIVNKILENEWYFGFGGIITFKKSENLRNTIKYIVRNNGKILLETDSPYITPEPHRGKKNYPYYLKIIYQYLQDFLKQNDLEIKINEDIIM